MLGSKLHMEKVYVENEWYDGPRKGIADYRGKPHRFIAKYENEKGYLDVFSLFPIPQAELDLEVEQWKIFVEWNYKYESGESDVDSHPGNGGISARYDEIDQLLEPNRNRAPESSITVKANFVSIDRDNRYEETGPDYGVIWKPK